ncbi:nucleoside hydrolase [Pseudogracilibacillus sp. SE30717A]|uniref:nucleoside hydrolase n=1 Tax=Pseudogracilibacillus sp. SE30717A TaxID=3098293 RepID=UPI00300DD160
MEKKKVILDVDTGIDDALAIAYATKSKCLDLLGITTCFGNVHVEDATRNTQFVLQLLKEETPVYQGSERPLSGKEPYLEVAKKIHGNDGLGNHLQDKGYAQHHQEEKHAIDFVIDTVKTYPHEITLIFVGPLTNLARIIEKDPEIIHLVKEVVIMGGAVTVPGNVRSYAEANIFSDPNAAKKVLQSSLPITLVGLDVTMNTLLPRNSVDQWLKNENEVSQFFAGITNYYIDAYENFQPGIGGCGLHDPLAVGVVIDPSFVETKSMYIEVETTGDMIGKTSVATEGTSKINVCLKVEEERFLQHFMKTLEF